MRILIIDKDKNDRKRLAEVISSLSLESELIGLSDRNEYLVLGNKQKCDAVFLETELTDCSGIDLAQEIKSYSPRCNIIFVTSFPQHSLEAFKARPSGFVVKPYEQNDIKLELDNLRYPVGNSVCGKEKLRVVTFGSFNVYTGNREVMKFSRTLAKEIFAYLIDQCGYPVTSRDIAADVLGETVFDEKASKKVSKAISYLVSDLRNARVEDVIDKQNRQIRINKNNLSCDLYDALDGNMEALNGYKGKYMAEYSWSETSFAMDLLREETEKIKN